jgi:uncharacterized delta-60 repeat protein
MAGGLALGAPAARAGESASRHTAEHLQQHWHLDPSFGNDGIVLTDFPYGTHPSSSAAATIVQPDGEILVGGETVDLDGLKDVADVARYRPNGTLDTSFGTAGRVMIGPHALYRVGSIALQTVDGQTKIVLGVLTTFRHPLRYRCSVVRLNPDGSLDTDHDADPDVAFGNEGVKVIRFADNSGFCSDITVAPDGSIIGAVEAGSHRGDVGLFRLQPTDGALDPTFGGDGKMTIVAHGFQVAEAIALQPRPGAPARIVVGGLVSRPDGYDWALWRVTPDGRLDRSFGNQGKVVTPMRDPRVQQSFDSILDVLITPDRDIVAVGRYRAWPDGANDPQDTAAAVRYLPDGTLDTSFGDGGRVHIPYDAAGETEADQATLDPAGDILYAGPFEAPTYGTFLVGGFTADGKPDTSFGKKGFMTFPVRGGYDAAAALALDATGRLVVAGTGGNPGPQVHDEFAVARLSLSP